MDAVAERIYRNPSGKMSLANSFNDKDSREEKRGRKRVKTGPGTGHSASWRFDSNQKKNHASSRLLDNSDPFSVNDLLAKMDTGKYGRATEEILELIERKRQLMASFYSVNPGLPSSASLVSQDRVLALNSAETAPGVIDLDDDQDVDDSLALTLFVPKEEKSLDKPVVIIESDDENDNKSENFSSLYQKVILPKPFTYQELSLSKPCTYQELSLMNKPSEPFLMKDFLESNSKKSSKNIVTKDSVKINSMKISSDQESNLEKISSNQESNSKKISSKQESIPEKISSNQESNSKTPSKILPAKDSVEKNSVRGQSSREANTHIAQEKNSVRSQSPREVDTPIANGTEYTRNKGEYVGIDDENENDDVSDTNSDGLGDIWNDMSIALESSKDAANDPSPDDEDEECEHSFILKEDIGDVCRICGIINREISTIIEYNFSKAPRSTRTYRHEERNTRDIDPTDNLPVGINSSEIDFSAQIYPHPRHSKEMKPHQIEGFNFLISNLMTENPGGCILAHAPGSGKTFMIISFLQSFMAKYPAARPLVVLPRGILGIWKKEFIRWQVENIPLYDCYSAKADSRAQQLEVLKEWVKERSVLFLGYKQFSSIVCDTDTGSIAALCQNYLLKIPSILILDEGHTPRNQDTDVLTSLERVETPRKVVLSGTLYQNHVREVFNILNLVRPKFLKMESSKAIKRRILSKAEINSRRNLMKHGRDNEFYELIEHTLIKDENHTRKVTVIQDLRQMTKKVLHYYKGDNLDELPGLVDFSVYLRLSRQQKSDLENLIRTLSRKFTITAQGSAIYVHPSLKFLAKNAGVKDRVDERKIDEMLEKINIREGVKLNFYLNLLELCESTNEKILVFSQYLLPLKFLERITAKVKGYTMGKEMFMITGDSDNETREIALKNFNDKSEARVFFGSIRACGEGISLVGASRIIILDIHLNPSITRQAIGRAFRPGQVRKVYTYRLISADSPEEEDHDTCFKKESIAKMWFEWDECRGATKFDMETVDVNSCGDSFLESDRLKEDVVAVKKR